VSEEPQERPKKREKPPIGGIGQYTTLGGGASRRSEVLPSNPPAGQPANSLEVQEASSSSAQTSNNLSTQTFSSSSAQTSKRGKPKRNKQTVYLEDDVDRWIRHRIADTREEISDVVNAAVRRLMQG